MAVADCWMKPVQVGAGSWVLRASAARKAQLADQLPSQRSISLHESLREEHSLGGGFILEAFRGRRFGVAGAGEGLAAGENATDKACPGNVWLHRPDQP